MNEKRMELITGLLDADELQPLLEHVVKEIWRRNHVYTVYLQISERMAADRGARHMIDHLLNRLRMQMINDLFPDPK